MPIILFSYWLTPVSFRQRSSRDAFVYDAKVVDTDVTGTEHYGSMPNKLTD
jgi:hypothetical protein